jgi:hypothetical protein
VEEGCTRTVLLGDARDTERHLRVTWHPDSSTVVFSHWNGPVCAASTPVELDEASRLVDLLVGALRDAASITAEETTIVKLPRRTGRGPASASGANERGE